MARQKSSDSSISGPAALTPRDLAEAIGASESSVRRWIDAGDLRVARTVGGHRRIPLSEAVRFVRKIAAPVVRPDILGLGALRAPAVPADAAADPLFAALEAADHAAARGIVLSAYLQGQNLPAFFDGPLRAALHRVGELWRHDERGILIEHRAVQLAGDVLSELRRLLPDPAPDAPLALGAAPEGDPYALPSRLAALTLQDTGWRAIDFGPNTPTALLADEAIAHDARLVWLSLSATEVIATLKPALAQLAQRLAPRRIELVIGGQAAASSLPPAASPLALLGSMSELAAFARGIRGRDSRPRTARRT